MKNLFSWTLLSVFALMTMTAFASDEITEEHNGFHPYKSVENFAEPNAHWGMYVNGGFSRFDGDGPYGISKAPFNMDFHLGATYDFTPLWGLQVDLGRTGYGLNVFKETDENLGGKFVGHMYNVGADLTFNFMNAFFPKRKSTLFNMYANLGGGLGMYTLKGPDGKFFDAGKDVNNDAVYSTGLAVFTSDKRKINCTPYIDASLLMSFNITRTFALGVKAGYMMYFNDYIDGNAQPRVSGSNKYTAEELAIKQSKANRNNDGMWVCDLQAHWNFCAKGDSHVRNYANQNVFDQMIADRKAAQMASEQQARAIQKDTLVISHKDTLVVKHEEQAVEQSDLYFVYFDVNRYTLDDQAQIDVQQMATRLQRKPNACLELSGFCDNTGSDAINEVLAEKRANMVRRTLIDVYGIDSTRLIDLGRGKLTNVNSSFGPNRRVDMRIVDRTELEIIRVEKQKAIEEKQRKIEEEKAAEEARIAAEKAAKEAKAAALQAQKDSIAAVKAAKAAALKAQKDSIAAALKAQKDSIAAVKAAKAAALKAQKDSIAAAAAEKAAAAKAEAEAEAAKSTEEKLSEIQMIPYDTTKYIGAERAMQSTTLSKLARKYYGNTNCWAHIYKANKEVIRSASYIFPGTKIYMPILTEEEKNITKEEAIKLAQTVNQ